MRLMRERDFVIVQERLKGRTFNDIAKEFGVSRSRVPQIFCKIMREVRRSFCEFWMPNDLRDELRQSDYSPSLEQFARWKEAYLKREIQPTNISDDSDIEELNLSVRAFNSLKRSNISTVQELLRFFVFPSEYRIRNFGIKSEDEVRVKLKQLGLLDGNET